jgi:hypothetical protein
MAFATMNRHERRRQRVIVGEARSLSIKELAENQHRCGWAGCAATYTGTMPPDWCSLIVHGDPGEGLTNVGRRVMIDVKRLTWRHDKVLCPEHALALDALLGFRNPGGEPALFPRKTSGSA